MRRLIDELDYRLTETEEMESYSIEWIDTLEMDLNYIKVGINPSNEREFFPQYIELSDRLDALKNDILIGYHTPERTKEQLDYFNENSTLEWADCSWHHDTIDSIYNPENEIKVYIPKTDEGVFTLEMWVTSDCGIGDELEEEYDTSDEVIKRIEQLKKG